MATALTLLLGKPFPEIIYDGEVNPARLVGGKLPREYGIAIKNNGAAKFANLGKNVLKLLNPANGLPKVDRDIKSYEGEMPPLPPVKLPEING